MDQQSIVMDLSLKGLNAVEIHNYLITTLKREASSSSIVMYCLGKPSFLSPKTPRPSESPAPILNESEETILLAFSEELFASARQLARRTNLPVSTVYDHLTYKLGFTVRYLLSVRHLRSEADKHTRAQLSFQLFEVLQHQKNRGWHGIITLDESWFYFTTDHEPIWLPEGTDARARERLTVWLRKMMVTIVWNPTGFYPIVALPKRMKFNPNYYISRILDPLSEWRRNQVGGSDWRLHVRAGNGRPHTAKNVTEFLTGNGMKRAPHPPYSLDMASRDFYLFGHIKGRLVGALFEEPDQLLQAIGVIFQSIEKARLARVFWEWMDRLA
jgi:transposase